MHCTACGATLLDAARFCHACGRPVAAGGGTPTPARAERRQLTVLFCDLADSTRLAARFDPEEWREVVSRYQETCAQVVSLWKGHLAQYLGDGILVYFGYPSALEDDATRAVQAGLQMVAAVERLNPELERRHGVSLAVRVGVHTGPVVIGEMGGGDKRETLAVGGATNIAARLQEVAGANGVALSAETLRLTRGAFETSDLGTQALKGAGEVRVYVAHRERASGASAAKARAPLVGRGAELDLLAERFALACRGSGQVVLIHGDAGLGKSRVAQALRERLATQPSTWLEGHCVPHAANQPFSVVSQLLGAAFAAAGAENDAAKLAKLAEWGVPPESLALVADLLGLPSPAGSARPDLSLELQRSHTLEALLACLCGVARERATVALIEDLHWADPSSLELLRMAIEKPVAAPLLLVLTARPEFEQALAGGADFAELSLERLTDLQSRELAAGVCAGRVIPGAALDSIAARSDGIPLYVEELTQALLEGGALVEDDGHLRTPGDYSEQAVPVTLYSWLMARLDRLGSAKAVAQIGATVGRDFSYDLLARVADLEPAQLRSDLARLVDAGLLFQRGELPEAAFSFKHALIQDAAYESLLRRERQPLHERIARALESDSSAGVGAAPELMALHYDRAGRIDLAVPYYHEAGERARARGANLEAIAHLRRGIELVHALPDGAARDERELALQLCLGPTLHAAHGLATDDTHRAWARARALCATASATPSQLAAALRGMIMFYDGQAEIPTALELGHQMLELGQRTRNDDYLLAAHSGLGVSHYWLGEFEESLEHFEAALATYEPTRHAKLALVFGIDHGIESLGFSSWALWALGFQDRALARIEAAVSHAQTLTHQYSVAYAYMLASGVYLLADRFDECARAGEECIRLSERHGFPLFRGVARAFVALVNASTRGEDTLADATAGLAEAGRAGQRAGTPAMMWLLARIHRLRGRDADAVSVLDAALALSAKPAQPCYDAELLRLKGEIVAARDPAAGESLLGRSLSIARRQHARTFELRAATSLARLWLALGRTSEARELLAPLCDAFSEGAAGTDSSQARELVSELE